ncbi:sensor histidine kinase [Streptomyces noursei]|uniref:sensor histidine kinase n=1 Tax=Streptomyces noursei TaxID=1971 RepID=UPI001962828F|nr:ATP-binding protein [Streptomyces noursei]QRX89817.1 sensor histidine kinase KdpD [Streptomyces noursei]
MVREGLSVAPNKVAAEASDARPGKLKVFLGAAPGVGKTYRMLDEGRRRLRRGTDVVVAYAECHGRQYTEEMLDGLEMVPRLHRSYRGSAFTELDLDAVLARRPAVALVDELPHTNVPGGRNAKRWQDVDELLAAGIDVLTTVNVQHLESLNDVVEKITGVPQRETVPDDVVRRADQIELVDMPAEALRRRMAHGNIYQPEKVDAALAHYFRIGNLTALRELALLWVAGRVDETLQKYRSEHGIGTVWETRERVVVALTGGPEGETLIRRADRIADRPRALNAVRAGGTPISGGDLLAVHVARSDGLAYASPAALAKQRALVESLGGSYHSVVGDHVPTALLDFARAENATQLVLGTSRRSWFSRLVAPRGIGEDTVELSGDIDVHLVTHEGAGRGRRLPVPGRQLPHARRVVGPVAGLVLPLLLTTVLTHTRGALNLTSEALLFMVTVVGVACLGGVVSALLASLAASLLLNYYFIPPSGEFTITEPNNALALAVFALVAVTVAALVDRSLRLSRRAASATAEAETLSSMAGTILRGEQGVSVLLERTRETFGMESAELVPRAGQETDADEESDDLVKVPAGPDRLLVLRGRRLPASEHRVLTAFAAHLAAALDHARLMEAAAQVEPVKAADRLRTALLAAVSHDLRTPLASGRAAISSLRSRDVVFSPAERNELLATAEESLIELNRLVDNLLDMSRLRAGALSLDLQPTAFADVLPLALATLPATPVRIAFQGLAEVRDVLADPPLLERVIANLVTNAVRHCAASQRVLITASSLGSRVELRVVDQGPGLPPEDRDRIFVPFQRLGDRDNTSGLGLGLALSRGLAEAMGGTLDPEDTPGGGLTMVLSLRAAPVAEPVEAVELG